MYPLTLASLIPAWLSCAPAVVMANNLFVSSADGATRSNSVSAPPAAAAS